MNVTAHGGNRPNALSNRRSRLHMLGIRIARSHKKTRGWFAVRRDIDNPSEHRERRGPYPDIATAVQRGVQLLYYPASVSRHLAMSEDGFEHNKKSREAEKRPECAAYKRTTLLTEETNDEPLHSTLLTTAR